MEILREFRWELEIGDPTFLGWLTAAAYFLAAAINRLFELGGILLVTLAAQREKQGVATVAVATRGGGFLVA
jgi:hypothetical protein